MGKTFSFQKKFQLLNPKFQSGVLHTFIFRRNLTQQLSFNRKEHEELRKVRHNKLCNLNMTAVNRQLKKDQSQNLGRKCQNKIRN
jgi:hypothetical protein